MDDLAPRQREVLDFIAAALNAHGTPPTYREIGQALNITSTNGVADHVKALIKKGYLTKKSDGASRGIQLTSRSRTTRRGAVVSVPLIGHVAAGQPILAEENYERTFHLDRSMVPGSDPVFALTVRGDSMIEEGILDGDVVIVRQQSTARNGDIVVALIDGEATCKFFFHEGSRIRLEPANSSMKPIMVDSSQEAAIQGVVIGVYRRYH